MAAAISMRDERGRILPSTNAWKSYAYRCTYAIWNQMRRRCNDVKHPYYRYYGARGIRVEWISFSEFVADMGERPDGMTIERIDNDGNYSKGNCKWATQKEQMRNRRVTKRVQFEGKEYALAELAERFGIHPCVLNGRIKLGWNIERALTEKVRPAGFNQYSWKVASHGV